MVQDNAVREGVRSSGRCAGGHSAMWQCEREADPSAPLRDDKKEGEDDLGLEHPAITCPFLGGRVWRGWVSVAILRVDVLKAAVCGLVPPPYRQAIFETTTGRRSWQPGGNCIAKAR